MLVISETTAEPQVTTLTLQELTGQILAFKASALAQHACPQRVRHFCEKYADDAEFWSVWVRAGLLSSRLIFVWGRIFLFFCCHQLTASQSRATAGTWLLGCSVERRKNKPNQQQPTFFKIVNNIKPFSLFPFYAKILCGSINWVPWRK